MIKVSANSIEDCLLKASKELKCSCMDLDYEIVSYPSRGFLGIGKKEAQIIVNLKQKPFAKNKVEKISIEQVVENISNEINEMFALLPLKLDKIKVSKYDSNTILIHFKGEDSALLIGEKGYRYKAVSYLLFNWINAEYGLNTRLEIESFLLSQETMMSNYLAPIITHIKNSNESYITKPFDGILVYIALKELREHFPNRCIMVKTNERNETYIMVNAESVEQ